MEATYCVGNDVDVCRMFDQYLYKRSENVDLSLSIPHSNFQNGYDMNDQTFHTPSFGDEEFDIPAINPQQHGNQQHGGQQQGDQQQHYQPPMQGMQQMGQQLQQREAMGMHDPTGGYQQPLYLSGPDHGMVNPSYHSPQSNYQQAMNQQQHNNQLLMIQQQQQQQQQQQMMMSHGQPPPGNMPYGASPQNPQGRGNSPPAPGQEPTTSEDSDDSTPHPAMMPTMKRPSPEPADQSIAKVQKKPKVQKKKKKRDPNEPQKPVSAYALFFRDTQAAIKGQNPNASFGEVSKIVASMWDALDSEHKNVYKKKTEAAKKEYLKALAAYRASLVSKGASENEPMYGNYNYNGNPQYGGYNPQRTIPSPPMNQAPTPPTQQQNKKPGMMGPGMNPGSHPNQPMMPSPMGPVPPHMNMGHMGQGPHNSYMQQPHPQQQHLPAMSPQQQHVPNMSPQQQQQHVPSMSPHHPMQHMSPPPHAQSGSPPIQAASPAVGAQAPPQHVGRPQNACIRHGCPNPAITNPEWEDEYCSNECVVSHCRDVFTNWVAGNKNQSQNYSTVK